MPERRHSSCRDNGPTNSDGNGEIGRGMPYLTSGRGATRSTGTPQRGRGSRGNNRGGRRGPSYHPVPNISGRSALPVTLRPAPPPTNPAWRVPGSLTSAATGFAVNQRGPFGPAPSTSRHLSTQPRLGNSNGSQGAATRHEVDSVRGDANTNSDLPLDSAQSSAKEGSTTSPGTRDTGTATSVLPATERVPREPDLSTGFKLEQFERRSDLTPTPTLAHDGCGTRYVCGSEGVSHAENPEPLILKCREPPAVRRFVAVAARDALIDIRKQWETGRTQYVFLDPRDLHSRLAVHDQLVTMAMLCRDLRIEFNQRGGDWSQMSAENRVQADAVVEVILGWHAVIERKAREGKARKNLARGRKDDLQIRQRNAVTAHEQSLPSRTGQDVSPTKRATSVVNDTVDSGQTGGSSMALKVHTSGGDDENGKADDGLNVSRPYLHFLVNRIRPYLDALLDEVNRLRAQPEEDADCQDSLDLITGSPIRNDRALHGFQLPDQPAPAKLTKHLLGLIEREGKVDMVARELHGNETPLMSDNIPESPSSEAARLEGECLEDASLINI